MDEERKSPESAKPSRALGCLRKAAIVAGVGFLVIAVPLAFVAGPDQVRTVPAPVVPPGPVAPTPDSAPPIADAPDEENASAPVIDTSNIEDPSTRERIEELNRRYSEALREHSAFHERLGERTFDESFKAFLGMSDSRGALLQDLARKAPSHPDSKSARARLVGELIRLEQVDRVRMFTVHERWEDLAYLYMIFDDWDKEVHYRRRCGLKGRFQLAVRSVFRSIKGLREESK